MGRKLQMDFAEPLPTDKGETIGNAEGGREGTEGVAARTVFVRNLGVSVGANELRELFGTCGQASSLRYRARHLLKKIELTGCTGLRWWMYAFMAVAVHLGHSRTKTYTKETIEGLLLPLRT